MVYLIIFIKLFILVRITVDPELIPGTLGAWWEYTLDRRPVYSQHIMHTNAYTFTSRGKLE